jgi:hypothetical protein
MTPPPLPSHLGIGARHTGHLDEYQIKLKSAMWSPDDYYLTYLAARAVIPMRAVAAPIAVNKHSPHMI